MDSQQLEQIVKEELRKVLAQREREEQTLLPPDPNETIDPNACRGPACSIPSSPASTARPVSSPTPNATARKLDPDRPAVLCLFSGGREAWDTVSEAIREWHQNGVQLDAVFSSGARAIFDQGEIESLGIRLLEDPKELWDTMYHMNRYSAVFMPSISRTHAAKLALGITDTLSLNLSLASLAQNVPTFASEEGLAPNACIVCGNNVPGIQEVLANYRDQLAKMGMKLLPASDCVKQVQRVVLNKAESGSDLITTLVTEEEAVKLNGPVVKVARGGLITPLAMDLLTKRGIEVVIVPKQ